MGFVVPHGVQGTEAPVKAYHMETVCGDNGFCGQLTSLTSRYLCVRLFIRVIAVDAQIPFRLLVIDGSAVVGEAVTFHGAVHITLRRRFRLLQRLVIQLFIKAVFHVMIYNHLIWRGHPFGILVDGLFCQPFRFFRQGVVQFPQLGDLCVDIARPQVLFRTSASA